MVTAFNADDPFFSPLMIMKSLSVFHILLYSLISSETVFIPTNSQMLVFPEISSSLISLFTLL